MLSFPVGAFGWKFFMYIGYPLKCKIHIYETDKNYCGVVEGLPEVFGQHTDANALTEELCNSVMDYLIDEYNYNGDHLDYTVGIRQKESSAEF